MTFFDRLSSFRARLTLFFAFIVIIPMLSMAVILFRLLSDNETGKADARIAARQRAAIGLFYDARQKAGEAATRIGRDPALAAALRANDPAALARRVHELRRANRADRIVVTRRGHVLADDGNHRAIFPQASQLVGRSGQTYGVLQVSVQTGGHFVKLVREVTGMQAIVREDGTQLGSTLPDVNSVQLPLQQGHVTIGGVRYRVATFAAPTFNGRVVRASILDSAKGTSSNVRKSRILAGAILIGFFILAFTFAVLVSRSLQRQIEGFLEAARRLGGGDFTAHVPTTGRDEFAALGEEFNKMSHELERRLEELRDQRARLENSMRRIGETFASNLDRDALLEIVVRTAVEGVGADGGRASVRAQPGEALEPVARNGDVDGLEDALRAAEAAVLESGDPHEVAVNGTHALAHPLRRADSGTAIAGLVSVARTERAFTASERELFHYLAGQAAVSIENVGLHETVERQAVTDELTGLFNRRRFQEALATEVERSKRFGQEMGLVMLDIDDFKKVNDEYGHQQGDLVLREVARVLRASAREIDEPARYGGEELAVVLPGTDLEGAYRAAERVREGIEALELPIVGDGPGTLKITASFGVATLPTSATDLRGLVAAADAALYEAKRAGKNRTVRAG
jgi:diguanylate cyclase (GGDEF)-like protein